MARSQAAMNWSRFFSIPTREPTGRVQRKLVQDVIAVASRNRIRMGVHPDEVRSQLAGSVLGRLRLQGNINTEQYEAGVRFGRLVQRYAAIMGIPLPNPRSAGLALLGGQETIPEAHEDDVMETRRDYEAVFSVIMDHRDGRAYMQALKSCILADQQATLGDLRCGLNVLCHLWR